MSIRKSLAFLAINRAVLVTGAIAVAVLAAVSLGGIGQADAGTWVCNVYGCYYVPTCNPYTGFCY